MAPCAVPLVYAYVLDPATRTYVTGEMFTGTVEAVVPFRVEVDLITI